MPDGKAPGRLCAARRRGQGRARQGRSGDLRAWRRHAVALADVGHRPRRAHHRAHQHDPAGHFRARQPRVRFRQGGVSAAHGGGERFRSMPPICAAPDGQPLPGFRDRAIVDVRRRADRADRRRLRRFRAGVESGRSEVLADASRPSKERAEALRREGADFVVAVMHAERNQAYEVIATHTVDVALTGHTHDLFMNFDGRSVLVEVGLRCPLRGRDRHRHRGEGD